MLSFKKFHLINKKGYKLECSKSLRKFCLKENICFTIIIYFIYKKNDKCYPYMRGERDLISLNRYVNVNP